MKKLITALVLTLSTAVAAQQANQQPRQDQNPQAQQGQNQNTQAQQEQQRNEGRNIGTGIDATEVGPGLRDAVGLDTEQEGTFKKDKAFSLNGTMKGSTLDGITLARPDLPDANLDVRRETQVMLDGKRVEVGAIPEGAQVRAQFQLEGGEPVAVTINASTKGKKGAKKGMKSKQGNQQGMQQNQPDTQR